MNTKNSGTPPQSRKAQKNETDKPHDTRLKELFHDKGAFISLLRDCIKPDWAADIDEGSLKRSETSFILQDFRKKDSKGGRRNAIRCIEKRA